MDPFITIIMKDGFLGVDVCCFLVTPMLAMDICNELIKIDSLNVEMMTEVMLSTQPLALKMGCLYPRVGSDILFTIYDTYSMHRNRFRDFHCLKMLLL